MNALPPALREKAVIAKQAPADYRAAGIAQPPKLLGEGVALKDVPADQQKLVRALLATYCQHFPDAVANQRLATIDADGWNRVYFAWAGSTTPGVGHYYRLEGPTFLLELVNIQSDPQGNQANHIHSVWRNPQGDFGLQGAQ